jgi:hypothetical protein
MRIILSGKSSLSRTPYHRGQVVAPGHFRFPVQASLGESLKKLFTKGIKHPTKVCQKLIHDIRGKREEIARLRNVYASNAELENCLGVALNHAFGTDFLARLTNLSFQQLQDHLEILVLFITYVNGTWALVKSLQTDEPTAVSAATSVREWYALALKFLEKYKKIKLAVAAEIIGNELMVSFPRTDSVQCAESKRAFAEAVKHINIPFYHQAALDRLLVSFLITESQDS